MDLSTIAYIVMFALGLVGADSVIHADSIVVDVTTTTPIGAAQMDQPLVAAFVDGELRRIAATRSVVADPEIVMGSQKSIAMALADVAKVRAVAAALQSQFGYEPTTLKVDVFVEGGTPKVLVSARTRGHAGDFEELISQRPDETVPDVIRRAVLVAMSKLDPYTTALYLVNTHAGTAMRPGDNDFAAAESLSQHAIAMLPHSTINADRAMFENLLGIIALFRNDPELARKDFVQAAQSNPANVAALLNVTFIDLRLRQYELAAKRMAQLVNQEKPANKVLLAVAYQMWALAAAGLGEHEQADQLFAMAVDARPERPTTYEYWSSVKRRRGDDAASVALHAKATELAGKYLNYAEVATMYFSLEDSGKNTPTLVRTSFVEPPAVSFR